MSAKTRGFTIVELLIVIVVIAILAAITIVAYNGMQQRARDGDRQSGVATIQKALEMYRLDNGGYPTCDGATYIAGGVRGSCNTTDPDVVAALSPKYISRVPQDPRSTGDYRYFYVYGSKKATDVTYAADSSDNYIIGIRYESREGPYVTAWGTTHNQIVGSNN